MLAVFFTAHMFHVANRDSFPLFRLLTSAKIATPQLPPSQQKHDCKCLGKSRLFGRTHPLVALGLCCRLPQVLSLCFFFRCLIVLHTAVRWCHIWPTTHPRQQTCDLQPSASPSDVPTNRESFNCVQRTNGLLPYWKHTPRHEEKNIKIPEQNCK